MEENSDSLSQAALRGRVIRLHGKYAYVQRLDEVYCCSLKGKLKHGKRKQVHPVAVGDWAYFELQADGDGAIKTIEERKTILSRQATHASHLEQILAANVDQLIITLSAERFEQNLELLDRLLISADISRLSPLLQVNKIDLIKKSSIQEERTLALLTPYQKLGIPIAFTSIFEASTIQDFSRLLENRTSVFVGPSGAGKSSTLNALRQDLELRTHEVNPLSGEGRHTTTYTQLIPLVEKGYVVDTPGVREFDIWDLPAHEVALFYPDFEAFLSQCRFNGCTHTHEPHCAVKEAVKSGGVANERYQRYVAIYSSMLEKEPLFKSKKDKR